MGFFSTVAKVLLQAFVLKRCMLSELTSQVLVHFALLDIVVDMQWAFLSTVAKALAVGFCFETLHAHWTNTSDLVHAIMPGIRPQDTVLEPQVS